MIHVLRQHVPSSQARILVGALRSAGFHADVWGEQAAHFYGDLATGGCSVVVDDELPEDAEAFLNAAVEEAPENLGTEVESCPSDAHPPSVGTLTYSGAWVALVFSSLVTVITGLVGMANWFLIGFHSNLFALVPVMFRSFLAAFISSGIVVVCFVIIAAPLLLLIRGYRAGSALCRLVIKALAVVMVVVAAVADLG